MAYHDHPGADDWVIRSQYVRLMNMAGDEPVCVQFAEMDVYNSEPLHRLGYVDLVSRYQMKLQSLSWLSAPEPPGFVRSLTSRASAIRINALCRAEPGYWRSDVETTARSGYQRD